MIENPQSGDKGFTRSGQKIKVTEILPSWAGKYPVKVQIRNTMGTWEEKFLTVVGYEFDKNKESVNDFVRKADWL